MIDNILDGIEAILFDMDGTLIDSLHIWSQIDIEFFAKFGREVPEDYDIISMGMSFDQIAEYTKKQYELPWTVDEIKAEWNRMAEYKYEHEIMAKPYAIEFLKKCSDMNIKMAVCTSNSRHLVEKLFTRLNIHDYMSVILTSDEVKNGKPAPDIYLEAAKRLEVSPKHCIVFEDTVAGIEAGLNAKMRVCAVYDDSSIVDDIKKHEMSDFYISTYEDII